jgi:D-alanyl-D-alanine-carboxypeptidase/D-alanyl-D-alanine-endopeptidase
MLEALVGQMLECCMVTKREDNSDEPGQQSASNAPSGLLAEVRLLNDDHTPMDFVVQVLEEIFGKDFETAQRIMLEIHNEGVGVCGVYPYDIADAKVTEVLSFARRHQHPLQCVLQRGSSIVQDGKNGSFVPPAVHKSDFIRRILVDRVDERRLSLGMVIGITEAKSHSVVSYGCRDTRTGGPVNEKTIFEIGSITKLFTAILLSDMANRGEVRLDEPVSELLPAGTRVPIRNGKAITLRDLASHYSGLPRVPTDLGRRDHADDPYAAYTAEKLYQFLATHELIRTPGDSFEYSNLGVGLLGHALVLRAGAISYESLIRTRILDPLRMDDTVVAIPSRLTEDIACGHDDSLDPVSDWNFDVLAGAGAFRSNLSDLLRFMDALCDQGSPISSTTGLLMTPRDRGGLELGPPHPNGGIAISHSGGTGGFRSFLRCIPEWNRGVAVLSNTCVDAVVDLGVHVLDSRCGLNWFRKAVAIDPACFARLVGRYRLRPNWVFDVTSTADRLYIRLTDQPALRAFPVSEWHFFYKCVGAQVTFEPGEDGRASRLILHQNSADQIAERIDG